MFGARGSPYVSDNPIHPMAETTSAAANGATHVNEYEREPVPDKALKGPSSFWGM